MFLILNRSPPYKNLGYALATFRLGPYTFIRYISVVVRRRVRPIPLVRSEKTIYAHASMKLKPNVVVVNTKNYLIFSPVKPQNKQKGNFIRKLSAILRNEQQYRKADISHLRFWFSAIYGRTCFSHGLR